MGAGFGWAVLEGLSPGDVLERRGEGLRTIRYAAKMSPPVFVRGLEAFFRLMEMSPLLDARVLTLYLATLVLNLVIATDLLFFSVGGVGTGDGFGFGLGFAVLKFANIPM